MTKDEEEKTHLGEMGKLEKQLECLQQEELGLQDSCRLMERKKISCLNGFRNLR